MSPRHRCPQTRGPVALLLAGTLSAGVGVVLHLSSGDTLEVMTDDVGAVPVSSASPTAASRGVGPDQIPVLTGMDGRRPRSGTSADGREPPPRANTTDPTVERGPTFTDPTMKAAPPRVPPDPLPPPQPSLGRQDPWLVSPLYPMPDPPPAAPKPVVPAELVLPARSVTAPVDPVGTDRAGGMVIPEEVRSVGWWAPGVLPGGASGSAVIAGHIDSRTQGVGVLAVLPQLVEGEPILVRDAAGRTATFRVAARREYDKYDLPREVFRRDGAPQLVLITCGGRFDPMTRSYESNIVVYAVSD